MVEPKIRSLERRIEECTEGLAHLYEMKNKGHYVGTRIKYLTIRRNALQSRIVALRQLKLL